MNPEALVRLRGDVIAEPLFNSWYVTLPMIAPHTSAMLVRNQHIKILKSYLLSPDMHLAAANDPQLRGGPFANVEKSRVDEVRAHLAHTLISQHSLISLAEAIEKLDQLLQSQAVGHSLEPFYDAIPECLKGYVELVYDTNNVPSIRFIEGLLYLSEYYDRACQSVALSLCVSDTRNFVLSTPRLPDERTVRINRPFDDVVYDALFDMRYTPRPFGEICESLDIGSDQVRLFSSFFEPVPTARATTAPAVHANEVEVRYFGHACLLFQTSQLSVLFDPLISYEKRSAEDRYTYTDLPDVLDYVVITHGHLDHMVLETLLQLRCKTRNIIVPKTSKGALCEPSLKLMLRHLGFTCNIIELDEMEHIDVPGGSLTSVPFLGEHHDLNIAGKSAYWLKLHGRAYVIAADSANLDARLYDHLRRILGPVDTLFMGMECDGAPLTWFYGHLLTHPMAREMSDSRQGSGSDQQRATRIVESLGCKQVYIYAMGLEHWFGHILSLNYTPESKQIVESDNFLRDSNALGIAAERLYAMRTLRF